MALKFQLRNETIGLECVLFYVSSVLKIHSNLNVVENSFFKNNY